MFIQVYSCYKLLLLSVTLTIKLMPSLLIRNTPTSTSYTAHGAIDLTRI